MILLDTSVGLDLATDRLLDPPAELTDPAADVIAADHYLVEVGFVTRRWGTTGVLRLDVALAVAEVAWSLPKSVVATSISDMRAAWQLIAHTSWADAVHVAVAARLGAELWTTDRRLAANTQLPCDVRVLDVQP